MADGGWSQCSDRYGCGRWFRSLGAFAAHMTKRDYRCLSDEELRARGVPFLAPQARTWDAQGSKSTKTP